MKSVQSNISLLLYLTLFQHMHLFPIPLQPLVIKMNFNIVVFDAT